jgi:hypothetical protein
MRFIVMHKVDARMEAGGPPDQVIIREMGELVQGSLKDGTFLNGAGLLPSAKRVRIERAAGKSRSQRGPYAGKNELIAAVTMISASNIDAAVEHAETLADALGGAREIEVGPVVEPWDLGLMPKPEGNRPERFLLLTKATAADEASDTGSEHLAATRALAAKLEGKGAVLAAESFAPSSRGSRLAGGAKGMRSWVDGPFAESKELIAGFSLLSLPGRAEAVAWANRYAAILGDNEVDIRVVHEP